MNDAEHEPPLPAKVKSDQVKKLATLDESSFDASPGGFIPGPVGHAAAKVADAARKHTQQEHE